MAQHTAAGLRVPEVLVAGQVYTAPEHITHLIIADRVAVAEMLEDRARLVLATAARELL